MKGRKVRERWREVYRGERETGIDVRERWRKGVYREGRERK